MPRAARFVAPNTPHHVTRRGNRRQVTFFQDADYLLYLQLAKVRFSEAGLICWLYGLMPNQVHFIVVPPTENALRGRPRLTFQDWALMRARPYLARPRLAA